MRQQILEILERNSHFDPEHIAAMLGMDAQTVENEIVKMEQEGIILQYGAVINWEKAGKEDVVTALIDVRVTPQRDVGFDELAAKIYKYPEVQAVYLMSGNYDFSVQVSGNSLRDIAEFVGKRLSVIEGLQNTTTHFVLKKYKVSHVVLDDREKDERQVIVP